MTTDFPFHGQKHLPTITPEDIEAFNTERFQFAREFPGKAVGTSPFEVIRDASLRLLEAAMGEKKKELPIISDQVLQRYTGKPGGSVW
ncbi:MAG: hypothetical protein ACKVOE_03465 [Rickettsiales bacterium]